jgi:hypothetical protein
VGVGGGGGRGGERGWEAAARKRGFSIFDFREKGRWSRAAVEEEGFLFGLYSIIWIRPLFICLEMSYLIFHFLFEVHNSSFSLKCIIVWVCLLSNA